MSNTHPRLERELLRKGTEHAIWDITGGRLLEWVRQHWAAAVFAILFSGFSTMWARVAKLPGPLQFLIGLGTFVFVLAAVALCLFIRDKLSAQRPQHSNRIDEVRFEYMPKSPLEHGWKVAYGEPGPAAKWWSPADAPTSGAMSMQVDAGCAIEMSVEPNARLSDRLLYAAKYTNTTMIIFQVAIASADGAHSEWKWIKFELGNGQPHPTTGYEKYEWTLPISGLPLSNGWRRFNISLKEAVQQTWGTEGWTYTGLRAIRLRGNVSISPVECHQDA